MSRITDVPGSSGCFAGGFVTYSNEMKIRCLGVKEETLEKFGAVSSECALEMVRGCLRETGADISLGVTGIAGPEGGTPDKPVGTVFISLSTRDGKEIVEGFHLEGVDRKGFKEEVENRALGFLLGMVDR